MAFMGYETPVEMPSMGIYNTDLMKMYIAGVKDQYEKGQEEMKDFMKLYGDFYSPIAGDTLRYNDMTIGGARDMINQMLANGIDPYKSPEARAAISRYIASVPTGTLNAMKQNAENRKAYDQAVAQARLSGKYDPEYEAWALKQAGLDNFSTIGPNGEVRVWDRLAPDPKQEWADIAAPYLKEFEKTEFLKSDVPGFIKEGVSDENQKKGVDAVMNAASTTPWLLYKLLQAYDRTAGMKDESGAPLSEVQRRALAAQDVRKQAEDTAAQYYQSKYEVDPYYKKVFDTNQDIREHRANRDYDVAHPLSTKTNPTNTYEETGYYPLLSSTTHAIDSLLGSVPYKTNLGTILVSIARKTVKNGGNADQIMRNLTRSDDAGRFAAFMNRQAVNSDKNSVFYTNGDLDRLYSSTEILSQAGSMNSKGEFVPIYKGKGVYGAQARKAITKKASSNENVTIIDQGGVTPIQIGNTINVYKPVKVDGYNMYYDTGYRIDAKTGELLVDESIGALQGDVRAGKLVYGLKLSQSIGSLK